MRNQKWEDEHQDEMREEWEALQAEIARQDHEEWKAEQEAIARENHKEWLAQQAKIDEENHREWRAAQEKIARQNHKDWQAQQDKIEWDNYLKSPNCRQWDQLVSYPANEEYTYEELEAAGLDHSEINYVISRRDPADIPAPDPNSPGM